MRLIISALVFLMMSVTVVGSMLTVVLSAPELGLDGPVAIIAVAGSGFVLAVPLSYWVAGKILEAAGPNAGLKKDQA